MELSHRSIAYLCRRLLIAMAASALVQGIALWRPLVFVLIPLSLYGLVNLLLIIGQYYGLIRQCWWADGLELRQLNRGLLRFVSDITFIAIGGGPTWHAFLT
ncbi:MAG: hypothetical protein AAF959_01080 [Cyanobacteria bacterium P01_D01_bin.56]